LFGQLVIDPHAIGIVIGHVKVNTLTPHWGIIDRSIEFACMVFTDEALGVHDDVYITMILVVGKSIQFLCIPTVPKHLK
jgi:hypothetical protein